MIYFDKQSVKSKSSNLSLYLRSINQKKIKNFENIPLFHSYVFVPYLNTCDNKIGIRIRNFKVT